MTGKTWIIVKQIEMENREPWKSDRSKLLQWLLKELYWGNTYPGDEENESAEAISYYKTMLERIMRVVDDKKLVVNVLSKDLILKRIRICGTGCI